MGLLGKVEAFKRGLLLQSWARVSLCWSQINNPLAPRYVLFSPMCLKAKCRSTPSLHYTPPLRAQPDPAHPFSSP